MSSNDEKKWLQNFYNAVPLEFSHDFSKHRKKLDEAGSNYLRLDSEGALEIIDEIIEDLSTALPHPKIKDVYSEALALKLLIHYEGENISPPEAIHPFIGDILFMDKLPTKIQSELQKRKLKFYKFSYTDLPIETSRVLIFGKEKPLPQELSDGRHLIHAMVGPDLITYWLVAKGGTFKFNKISEHSIWTSHESPVLKTALEVSKPPRVKDAGLSVIVHGANEQPTSLLISAPKLIVKKNTKPNTINWANEFENELIFEDEQSLSMFKSPWFWVLSGAVASVGGYFIYENFRGPTVVRTP